MDPVLFRLPPQLQTHQYKTYQLLQPRATHWRDATCPEVGCPAHLRGWETTVDVGTELGRRQAYYIRMNSGRSYTHTEAGTLVTFRFPAGQRCFTQHRVPLERDPFYLVRGGDWRGNPLGDRLQHRNAEDWTDDFATHQQALADTIKEG